MIWHPPPNHKICRKKEFFWYSNILYQRAFFSAIKNRHRMTNENTIVRCSAKSFVFWRSNISRGWALSGCYRPSSLSLLKLMLVWRLKLESPSTFGSVYLFFRMVLVMTSWDFSEFSACRWWCRPWWWPDTWPGWRKFRRKLICGISLMMARHNSCK